MSDLEKYFDKYRGQADFRIPLSDGEKFLGRLHDELGGQKPECRKHRAVRCYLAMSAACGIAAAAVAVTVLWLNSQSGDVGSVPAELYVQEYRESLEPLCDEVRYMESVSEECRQMQLSSVIEELLASSEDIEAECGGLDEAQMLEVVRTYCGRQTDCIRNLYAECVEVYETGACPVAVRHSSDASI